jgi:hypothetical protein
VPCRALLCCRLVELNQEGCASEEITAQVEKLTKEVVSHWKPCLCDMLPFRLLTLVNGMTSISAWVLMARGAKLTVQAVRLDAHQGCLLPCDMVGSCLDFGATRTACILGLYTYIP